MSALPADGPPAPAPSSAPPPVVRHDSDWREQLQRWSDLVILEIRKTYARSFLGLGWAIAEPLLFLGIYFMLFVVIKDDPYEGAGGPLGFLVLLFSGLVPWLFFAKSVSLGMQVLASHGMLVKQINFPIHLLPFVSVTQASVEFGISLLMLTGIALAAGMVTPAVFVAIPASLLLMGFLVGLGYILACYNTLLPDLGKILPTALRGGMFLSPVLYLPSDYPSALGFLPVLNPLSYLIAPFRYAFLPGVDVFVFGLVPDMLIGAGIMGATLFVAWMHRGFVRRTVVDYL